MPSNKVILKKSWTNRFKRKYPVGYVLGVDDVLGSELIKSGIAEKYEGEYPPKGKQKIELSNIK